MSALPLAYARSLHKLMAYKDEYEVARLHLDTVERSKVETEFGAGADVSVLLHPPLLRALGMRRKIVCVAPRPPCSGSCTGCVRCGAPAWIRSATQACGARSVPWSRSSRCSSARH